MAEYWMIDMIKQRLKKLERRLGGCKEKVPELYADLLIIEVFAPNIELTPEGRRLAGIAYLDGPDLSKLSEDELREEARISEDDFLRNMQFFIEKLDIEAIMPFVKSPHTLKDDLLAEIKSK